MGDAVDITSSSIGGGMGNPYVRSMSDVYSCISIIRHGFVRRNGKSILIMEMFVIKSVSRRRSICASISVPILCI